MKFVTAIAVISTASTAAAFTGLSTFSGRPASSNMMAEATNRNKATGYRASLLMYENSRDPPNRGGADANVWTVLAHTEKWISETLAANEQPGGRNPYSRKEVNYVCETNEDSPMIVANIFKRLREARETGEEHGVSEEDRQADQGEWEFQFLNSEFL